MAPPSQASCASCNCFNPSEPLTQFHWSRLESQLRENQPFSDIERQTIAKVEQDIEGYDREIARMELAIVSLQYKRDLAKDYVSRHKSLLAPVRRIPDDALVEIFEHCSAEARIEYGWVCLSPLNLSQVCSHWRSVANASPVLWSTFEMSVKHPAPADARFSDAAIMNIVNMFLAKSGDRSLTMNLTQFGTGEDIHPALQLLLNHSHRWMSVTLDFSASVLEDVLSVSGGFPRLQHLNIMEDSTATLPVAPRMRSLSLDVAEMLESGISLGQQDFPWSQLREIELYNSTTADCTDVFSWCNQLQCVRLKLGKPLSSDQPITSATVVSMTFEDRQCDDGIENFLRLARFPQLHTLELAECDFSLAYAYPFVSHSPLITTLSLIWLVLDFGDVLELLRLLPTVISLQWYQEWSDVKSGAVDHLFSKLCPYPSDSRTLLPRLKHFDVRVTGVADVTDFNVVVSFFVKMVQARWMEKHADERLKSVQLSFPKNCLNHDLIRPLVYLREDGMAISIQDKCGFIL